MKVNKIATMYKLNSRVNCFGVPLSNPVTLKQDLHRVCVVYPKTTTYHRSSYTEKYRFEYNGITEESKFGNIPLGVV